MSFASPWLLLTLLLVPVAIVGYFLLERRRADRAQRWSSSALMPNMVPSKPGFRRYVPLVLFLIALVLLLAGFARPQATIDVPREGATVVLALDISGSMDAKDVPSTDGKGRTTRLLAARQAASDFLDKLPDKYRVSLVTFGNRGSVRVPPTYDHDKMLNAIPLKALTQGTALASGIDSTITVAQRAFGKPEPGEPPNPVAVAAALGRREHRPRGSGRLGRQGAQDRPADLDRRARHHRGRWPRSSRSSAAAAAPSA